MRTLFVLGILLVCAFMAGWFTVNRDDEGTTIRINRDEIRGDTRQAIDRGREILDREKPQAFNEQVAQQPFQGYADNGQSGYDAPSAPYQQQPTTDPSYQNSQYQNSQYQNSQYQDQSYPPRTY